MCPDRGLLSAWIDGEVPSPWNGRIDAHVASCAACAARLKAFRGLSAGLAAEGAAASEAERAMVDRLRESLAPAFSRAAAAQAPARPVLRVATPATAGRPSRPAWGRVSLPLPLAAAAAFAVVFLAGLALANFIRPAGPAPVAVAASDIVNPAAGASSMEELIRFIESQDAQVSVTIHIPGDATFEAPGQPLIMKSTPVSVPGGLR